MPFTVTFTADAFVAGSLRTSGNTLLVDDPTARMLVDLGVATAPGLTAQTGAVAPNLARLDGATFTGKINTPAATTAGAFLNLAHGAQPTTPLNGDVYTTTSGLFARINGTTLQYAAINATSLNFGGTTLTFGSSAVASTIGIATGATTTGVTKTLNLATGALAGATTAVNIGSATGTSTITLNGTVNAPGLANGVKAWVNFNGTGTVAIRSSFNVTSITDNGVGDYTVNFTTAMADVNYSAVMSGSTPSGGGSTNGFTTFEFLTNSTTLARTTSAFRFFTANSTFNNADALSVNATFIR